MLWQLESLKDMLRSEMEDKARFRTQAEGIAASAGRYESAARSAKFSADKARAEVAVLEGALTGSKVGQLQPQHQVLPALTCSNLTDSYVRIVCIALSISMVLPETR